MNDDETSFYILSVNIVFLVRIDHFRSTRIPTRPSEPRY